MVAFDILIWATEGEIRTHTTSAHNQDGFDTEEGRYAASYETDVRPAG
jgi:hypothetical protein